MSHVSLKKLQRGPTMKLIASVVMIEADKKDLNSGCNLQTETINVDDMVQVYLKFPSAKPYDVQSYLSMKKHESVKNSTIQINITCGRFNERYICSDKWLQMPLNGINLASSGRFNILKECGTSLLYTFEVNITVREIMAVPYRLYEDTEFTDFQLRTADGTVAVHKNILSLHSDMFDTMLRGEWKETSEGCINVDGVTVQTLQHLKDYMYLGTLPDGDEGLQPLLLVATRYFMDKLKSDCIVKLLQSIKPENFEGLVQFACQSIVSTDLVKALIFQTPDDIVNSVHKLKANEKNANEKNN